MFKSLRGVWSPLPATGHKHFLGHPNFLGNTPLAPKQQKHSLKRRPSRKNSGDSVPPAYPRHSEAKGDLFLCLVSLTGTLQAFQTTLGSEGKAKWSLSVMFPFSVKSKPPSYSTWSHGLVLYNRALLRAVQEPQLIHRTMRARTAKGDLFTLQVWPRIGGGTPRDGH